MTEGGGSAANCLDDLQEVSNLLNTGLDRRTLAAAIQCIELGANPEALAKFVRQVRAGKFNASKR